MRVSWGSLSRSPEVTLRVHCGNFEGFLLIWDTLGVLWGTLVSLAGYHGVSLRVLWERFVGTFGTTFGVHRCFFEGSLKVL